MQISNLPSRHREKRAMPAALLTKEGVEPPLLSFCAKPLPLLRRGSLARLKRELHSELHVAWSEQSTAGRREAVGDLALRQISRAIHSVENALIVDRIDVEHRQPRLREIGRRSRGNAGTATDRRAGCRGQQTEAGALK